MKNILLGTTALIAVTALAAPAMAAERLQLELRGYSIQGITYTDGEFNEFWREAYNGSGSHGSSSFIGDYNEINFGTDSEVHFRGSTTLDNGLKISFRAELELEDDCDVNMNVREGFYDDDFFCNTDTVDEVYIQVDGGFGRFQFGQNDGAMYQMHIAAPTTFVGHKINNNGPRLDPFSPLGWGNPISTYGDFTDDHIKATYFTPSFNGFQLGLSYTPNPCKNDTGYSRCVYDDFGRNYWEIAATWQVAFDNVEFGFSGGYGGGESDDSGEEPTEWTLGALASFGGFALGGSYKETETTGLRNVDETHWDVGATYETGPWGFTLDYAEFDRDYRAEFCIFSQCRFEQEANAWIGGVTYMYGPGMQIGFGVQTLDAEDTAITANGDWWRFTEGFGFEGTSFFIENSVKF